MMIVVSTMLGVFVFFMLMVGLTIVGGMFMTGVLWPVVVVLMGMMSVRLPPGLRFVRGVLVMSVMLHNRSLRCDGGGGQEAAGDEQVADHLQQVDVRSQSP